MAMSTKFGTYMRTLRKHRGLTLKQVEKAAQVSNAYISQIERGLRNPPHPDILHRLAKTYNVSAQALMVEAGYLPEDKEVQTRNRVEQAYQHVISDPTYTHGNRLKGSHVSLEVKKFIVEMYEKMTGRKLLEAS